MTTLLQLKHVSKNFGGLKANAKVSFEVQTGSVVGLIGPNGSGKTTLFSCITGYYTPSHGDVLFDGTRLNGLRPDQICRLGLVRTWQKVRPLAKLTVLDNVMVGALLHTTRLGVARKRALEQLALVRLADQASTLAGRLSIGQRKRLEMARALATEPKLMLLDEVMGGLNPAESNEIIELILELKAQGLTLVVIEHDMRAIMRISDRIVVLNSGEKLADGEPAQIAKQPAVIAAYLGERVD
jgi:branched-chain amino acid transport system ATP-binding protein